MINDALNIKDEVLEKISLEISEALLHISSQRAISMPKLINEFLRGKNRLLSSLVIESFCRHSNIFTYITEERIESAEINLEKSWRQMSARLMINYETDFMSPSNYLILRSILNGFFIYDPLQIQKDKVDFENSEEARKNLETLKFLS